MPRPSNARAVAGAIGWAEGFATGEHRIEHPDEAVQAVLAAKPALAIWGAADRTLAAEHFVPLFEAAFPGAPVRMLERAGHYSPEDAPNDVIRLVDGFVAKSTNQA
jgi:haloalkane dehalogenase